MALPFRPTPAEAQNNPWRVEATLASEYISKGAGRSQGEPHAGLRIERTLSANSYAGLWTGSLRSPLGADGETHLYLGWRQRLADWTFNVQPTFKFLSGAGAQGSNDLWEVRVDASRPIAGNRLRIRVEQSFKGYGAARASTWVDAQLSRPIGESGWSIFGDLGRREQQVGQDYTAWSLGAGKKLNRWFSANAQWIDTDQHDAGREYRGRFVIGGVVRLK